MNTIAGSIEQFQHYAQFRNTEEFNRHMEMWLLEAKHDFTKSEMIALKRLIRFSVKHNGISNAKIGTILKAIHELDTKVGVSRATFKRMLVKAKTKGMLVTIETTRKSGGQASNLYIFQRHPYFDPPSDEKLNHQYKANNLLKTENKDLKERIGADRQFKPVDNFPQHEHQQSGKQSKTEEQPIADNQPDSDQAAHANSRKRSSNQHTALTNCQLDHTYTSDSVPKRFRDLVSCYFDAADEIEEYWRMARHAAYIFLFEDDTQFTLATAIDSFKQMIGSLKKGRVKNNVAYFYGVMYNKCGLAFYEDLREAPLE